MARESLRVLNGQRERFQARVERFGTKTAYRGPDQRTVLLRDVALRDTAEVVTEHVWFTVGKWSERLKEGDVIAFDARVGEYIKGYRGRREDVYSPISIDYRLQRPTKVVLIDDEVPTQARSL